MIAEVTHYEDEVLTQGEVITKYIIRVKHDKNSYIIKKRYSDFADLFFALKDLVPEYYRFPNKSVFNNNAQFTKERRVKGFDELLKLLCGQAILPQQLLTFLEIDENLPPDELVSMLISRQSEFDQALYLQEVEQYRKSSEAAASNTVPATEEEEQTADNNVARLPLRRLSSLRIGQTSESFNEISSQPPRRKAKFSLSTNKILHMLRVLFLEQHQYLYDDDQCRTNKDLIKLNLPSFLMNAVKSSSIVYFVIVIFDLVDFSNANLFQIIFSLLLLLSIIVLFEIRRFRMVIVANEE